MLWLLPVLVLFKLDLHVTCAIRGLLLREIPGVVPGYYERVGAFYKDFVRDENVLCPEDLTMLLARLKLEGTQLGTGDFSYDGVHVDDEGVTEKVITLI